MAIPSTNLAGKVAIVTGASRSIGEAIALELARRGAKVMITYASTSSDAAVTTIKDKIAALNNGAAASSIRVDLCSPEAPKAIVAATVTAFFGGGEDGGDRVQPHIDILINNAGVEVVKPAAELTIEDFATVYDLNVRAPLLMLQAVLPYLPSPSSMTASTAAANSGGGGRIVNIGSVGGRAGFKGLTAYCSSKAALEGMTRCWAAELGSNAHTVNCVNPGPVQSAILERIPPEIVEMQKATTPIENRLGTCDDIAQVVAWLASEESRWVTGQVISASGGWAMY